MCVSPTRPRSLAGHWHVCTRTEHIARRLQLVWPLHDIIITNIIWCMSYKREVEGGLYIARWLCNSIATVWAMQAGRKHERTIDSCTND